MKSCPSSKTATNLDKALQTNQSCFCLFLPFYTWEWELLQARPRKPQTRLNHRSSAAHAEHLQSSRGKDHQQSPTKSPRLSRKPSKTTAVLAHLSNETRSRTLLKKIVCQSFCWPHSSYENPSKARKKTLNGQLFSSMMSSSSLLASRIPGDKGGDLQPAICDRWQNRPAKPHFGNRSNQTFGWLSKCPCG